MTNSVYIAGKIDGAHPMELKSFGDWAEFFESLGLRVVNPLTIPEVNDNVDRCWHEWIQIGLSYLSTCDAIFVVPYRGYSAGTEIELIAAKRMGLTVLSQDKAIAQLKKVMNHGKEIARSSVPVLQQEAVAQDMSS